MHFKKTFSRPSDKIDFFEFIQALFCVSIQIIKANKDPLIIWQIFIYFVL